MAILLIIDEDHHHKDPEKDARGCYKRGMVVQVFEDGTPCVDKPNPPFVIVNVPGVSKADAEAKYMAYPTRDEWQSVDEMGDMECVKVPTQRRSTALDLTAVSVSVKEAVDVARVVTLDAKALPVCEKSLVTVAPVVK